MSSITTQNYADVLSDPHALFWDGHCTALSPNPRIRVALAAKNTGALGVLLLADTRRDVWIMVSGLQTKAHGDRLTLTGPSGLILQVSFANTVASGSIELHVSNKKQTKRYKVDLAIVLKKLSGPPGPPSSNSE